MRHATGLLLAAFLLDPSAAAAAQDSLRVGHHVRVTLLAGSPPITGRVVELDANTLGLRLDERSIAADSIAARRLARESIAGLEIGTPRSNSSGRR